MKNTKQKEPSHRLFQGNQKSKRGMIEGVTNYISFFGGLPGPTQFFFTKETLLASKGSKTALWQSLQQAIDGRFMTYYPAIKEYKLKPQFYNEKIISNSVTEYIIKEDLHFAVAEARNNPEHGPGGGVMLFVANPDYYFDPVIRKQDLSEVEHPSAVIQEILAIEMKSGNQVEHVDFDIDTKKLFGIYLTKPLQRIIYKEVTNLENSTNIFCLHEYGYICNETRQYISGPSK